MKAYYQFLLWTFLTVPVFSQDITPDQLSAEYNSGKLFVFNGYALRIADPSFFQRIIDGKISKIERLDSISGLQEYGTIGQKGVLRVQVDKLKPLDKVKYTVVNASVLKYFNELKELFYFIDGLPNRDIYFALDGLINKQIKEVKIISPVAATAIWGSQAINGAIVINTDGPVDLSMK